MEKESIDQYINFIPVKSKINWDEYFMVQAMIASFKSKDPSTKVGCVFVDDNNHQLSMGYNGMLAGIDESKIPWGNDRGVNYELQKYGYVIHSEANAIAHAKCSLKGARLYVTLFPCPECSKQIASHGVKEVIYLSDKYKDSDEVRVSKKLLEMASIRYRPLSISKELISSINKYFIEMNNIFFSICI